eukprot:Pgem_evm1s5506
MGSNTSGDGNGQSAITQAKSQREALEEKPGMYEYNGSITISMALEWGGHPLLHLQRTKKEMKIQKKFVSIQSEVWGTTYTLLKELKDIKKNINKDNILQCYSYV